MTDQIPKDLTPEQRDALPPRLRAVWTATFAAEWARWFVMTEAFHGFDHEDEFDHAEMAATVADRAVYQLRTWERDDG